MPSLAGVNYDYYYEGYDEGVGEEGPFVNVQVICDWNDRFTLQNAFMGLVTVSGGVGGPLTITRPQQWFDSPNLWAHDTHLVKAMGKPRLSVKGGVQYDKAVIGVAYRVPKFDLQGNDGNNSFNGQSFPYMRFSVHTSLEETPLSKSSFRFQDSTYAPDPTNNIALPQSFPYKEPIFELAIERYQVPYLPDQEVYSLLNNVNDSTFLGFDRGTVKFESINTDRNIQSDGTAAQTVSYTLLAKQHEWNMVWSPVAGKGWGLIWSDPTKQLTPYTYADLTPLIDQ